MTLRSWTEAEIRTALEQGNQVWVLNSGTHGADDVLIGIEEECRQDVIDNEERDVFKVGWTLTQIEEIEEVEK